MAIKRLKGAEQFSNLPERTQVYDATHDGTTRRLSYRDRSFISFSYGGKLIEDFGLIATTPGDRLQRNAYADFEDITNTYDFVDGQFYWGSHHTSNQLVLNLATDGITENQLDSFKNWFRPGVERELILSEHPNRAILARVGAVPSLSLLPFEKEITVMLDFEEFETSTTLYKGEIQLTFVMDEPFWYAKSNLLGKFVTEDNQTKWTDLWTNANLEDVLCYEDKDALKIIAEDYIPASFMINRQGMFFGGNIVVAPKNEFNSTVGGYGPLGVLNPPTDKSPITNEENDALGARGYAKANYANGVMVENGGIVGIVLKEGKGVSLAYGVDDKGNMLNGAENYLYYAGTAPSYPKITFTITPKIARDQSDCYTRVPYNSYVANVSEGTLSSIYQPYNSFYFNSRGEQHALRFSTPGPFTGYNQAIDVFKTISETATWKEVRDEINERVKHYYARAWANKCIDYMLQFRSLTDTIGRKVNVQTESNLATLNVDRWKIEEYMGYFLKKKGVSSTDFKDTYNKNNFLSSTITIDCKTGSAIGQMTFRVTDDTVPNPNTGLMWKDYGSVITVEEDVGEMIRTNDVCFIQRNHPNLWGNIVEYGNRNVTREDLGFEKAGTLAGDTAYGEEIYTYSYLFYHTVENNLDNVQIEFTNYYY